MSSRELKLGMSLLTKRLQRDKFTRILTEHFRRKIKKTVLQIVLRLHSRLKKVQLACVNTVIISPV